MAMARYVMIGGFLGAGKTTAMLRLGNDLAADGKRVGVITNDQSSGLADTAILSSAGFAVEEITGGCFCCRFNSLMDAAERLTDRTSPDVFLAEPVGSCTDLKATVSYPLRRIYGENYSIAPLSVVLDPPRALRILGLESGRRFSEKVRYVYAKQLEEADVIAVNKIDSVERGRVATLHAELAERYPRARIFDVSAKTGEGVAPWFDFILGSEDRAAANLTIDYDEYAEGEALLGWLNFTATVAGGPFDGNRFLMALATDIQARLRLLEIEIAHLKTSLSPDEGGEELGVANAIGSEAAPVASFLLHDSLDKGELIVNLRGEGNPDVLRREALSALDASAAQFGLTVSMAHIEHFRPSRPVPTHRVVVA